ncbi:hypothetical protein K8Z61_07670 [Nocardioides sp. TRM66260-LWL]|uniref:hypothetical protein n=1 Tax=Nocardioides sp. TRM66260-LWL TaxID=2874478 RepID=UPI001CC797C9|nr:hypothetical protein [Nocardioides sp. TRM66260-LWL]MBZ5734372.1 hypothetical protein [Nocardioides sp. TRM66260-LWL]
MHLRRPRVRVGHGRSSRVLVLLAVASASALGPTVAITAVDAAPSRPEISLGPRDVPRGADVAWPHIEGSEVVDGDVRLPVPGTPIAAHRAGDHLVVLTLVAKRLQYVSVAPGREPVRLARPADDDTVPLLADDATRLTTLTFSARDGGSTLRLYDTADGTLIGTRRFPRIVLPVDATGTRALLHDPQRGLVQEWDAASGGVRRITTGDLTAASYAADRLALLVGSGRRPCQQVVALSSPSTVLSRSCGDWVTTGFAPDGRAVQTRIPRAQDGLDRLRVLGPTGRIVGVYRVAARSAGVLDLGWLDDGRIIVTVVTRRTVTEVACDAERCERVAPVRPNTLPDRLGRHARPPLVGVDPRH